MTNEKMTKRDFYTKVMELTNEGEVFEFAQAQLEKLDETNEKRRNAVSKKAKENEPLKEMLQNEQTTEPKTATDLCGVIEGSVQKTSALLRQMVEEGRAKVTDVKVPKKGLQKGYTAVEA